MPGTALEAGTKAQAKTHLGRKAREMLKKIHLPTPLALKKKKKQGLHKKNKLRQAEQKQSPKAWLVDKNPPSNNFKQH